MIAAAWWQWGWAHGLAYQFWSGIAGGTLPFAAVALILRHHRRNPKEIHHHHYHEKEATDA